MWTKSMGGRAVIKAPYSTNKQGVWTILNERDLQAFARCKRLACHSDSVSFARSRS